MPCSTTTRTRARRLGRYPDASGRPREVVCQTGVGGSLLVIDRDAETRDEPRLVAHLSADEPSANAALVCEHYLREGGSATRCRALSERDLSQPPLGEEQLEGLLPAAAVGRFCLRSLPTGMSIPELRWCAAGAQPVRLRDAIAALESYDPLRTLTARALARHRGDPDVSTVALAAELTRVLESAIVLNRRLREVVLEHVRRDELSMSEIAIRCGRVKRDRQGKVSGETSWLARRIGLLADGGTGVPTRWIHSDVLALIAREGLGVAPREVELG